jgi:hypothetical protein
MARTEGYVLIVITTPGEPSEEFAPYIEEKGYNLHDLEGHVLLNCTLVYC